MKAYFNRLFEYNRWGYRTFQEHIGKYGFEHLEVFKLLSHCYNAEQIWLNRVLEREADIAVWEVHELSELFKLLEKSNQEWLDFIEVEHDFDRIVTYHNSKGEAFESSLSDIIAHVANHGTHHRAQVSTLLRQSGKIPPPTDLIFWAR